MPHLPELIRNLTQKLLLVALGLLILCPSITIAAAPKELNFYLPIDSEQFPKMLENLDSALKKSGLDQIKIITADYWYQYQQAIRKGRPGVYYAAPHYLAWTINQHNFVPLARLADPLKYVIATRRSNANIFEINDLNKKTACSERALNLDYLLINTAFDNPLYSAKIKTVNSVTTEMTNTDSPCKAFSVSNHHYIALEKSNPGQFIRLQQGQRHNNYGFSLHPIFAANYGASLRTFLKAESTETILAPMLRQTSSKLTLVDATPSHYPIRYIEQLGNYWQRNNQH